jgi:enoyl-CoA hydratase
MSVSLERDDRVVVLRIDSTAGLNAFDPVTLTELRDRLRDLESDVAIRAVVITGAGERAFSAGADIKYMNHLDPGEATGWTQLGQEVGNLLETMPQATIAVINGIALGGGCEVAIACDVRYASSDAKFGQPEINLGLVPGWGGTQRLARLTGLGFAKEAILTGRVIDANEALDRGLVNAIYDPPLEKALEVAHSIATKSGAAIAAAKSLVNAALHNNHRVNLEIESERFSELFYGEDVREGLAAFVEKRSPSFS